MTGDSLPSGAGRGGRLVTEICFEAFICLRVQESSVKKSADSVFKVHNDSVLHFIDTYNVHIHVNIVILFFVIVSPTQNNCQSDTKQMKSPAWACLMNGAKGQQFLKVIIGQPCGMTR
jgi:hypothetical protein